MFNGHYYKIEDVEFVKIPKQKTWFTKRIIDFTPFNIYISGYSNNAIPEHSIFKAMVEEIGKILETTTYMPTYDDSDFSVKPILDANNNFYPKLIRESTDYAKAVLNQFSGYQPQYRGVDMSVYSNENLHPYYSDGNHQSWWLGAQFPNFNPVVRYATGYGNLHQFSVNYVFGVVVCIR